MLTNAERLVLWNQYEILKSLRPQDASDFEVKQQILENGYEDYYSEINNIMSTASLDKKTTDEVVHILNTFRAIYFSCQKLNCTPISKNANFIGFDLNNEGDQYAFAKFLRRTLGKWEELKDEPDNSHMMTLNRYRRMLSTWVRLGKKYELTSDEIEQIANS